MGDANLLKLVTENFLAEMPGHATALLQAVTCKDSGKVQSLAHRIKGASATVGGSILFRLAGDMEQAGEAGDLKRLETLASHFMAQFEALQLLLSDEAWGQAMEKTQNQIYENLNR